MKLVLNNPEAEAKRSFSVEDRECPVYADFSKLLRVIENEVHPNLEKRTSSVLSVILINLW